MSKISIICSDGLYAVLYGDNAPNVVSSYLEAITLCKQIMIGEKS